MSKVSFPFLLELLSTGVCFVRLALIGKLIKACPPDCENWKEKGRKNKIIIISFLKYYYFLFYFFLYFCLFCRCVRDIRQWIRKNTHFYLLSIRYDFLFTFFEIIQKAVCFMVVLSHHYSYYFLFLVFCFYYYFAYIIIYFLFVCF